MRKLHILIISILALSLVAASLLGGCAPPTISQLKVVTSTSLIASIVERVGGDGVDVVNIIPPAQCPGHFDVKPSDIQKLAEADLFLLHGWQGEMFSQELIDSANNPDLTVISLDIPSNPQSNWMVPSVQQEATDGVAAALSQVDAANSSAYQASADKYKNIIKINKQQTQTKHEGVIVLLFRSWQYPVYCRKTL